MNNGIELNLISSFIINEVMMFLQGLFNFLLRLYSTNEVFKEGGFIIFQTLQI
jgi:hypothetical protein